MINRRKRLTPEIFIVFLALFVFFSQCSSNRSLSLENLETFARLYGYVRFFHPSEEASKIDWNHFAVYGIKQVEKAKTSLELKQTLEELFLPVAPSMVIYHTNEKKTVSSPAITPEDTTGMKVIAWQHRGVKLSASPVVYNSIRLNRKHVIRSGYGFGNLEQNYNAIAFREKEFLFKASVKVQSGSAQLWFRVDRIAGKTAFFENMHHHPIQIDQWKTYEISGTIAKDAENIAFGCFLNGRGKLFVDDFQFLVKKSGEWIPIAIINPGFEKDRSGENPGFWTARGNGYTFQVTSQSAASGTHSVTIESKTVTGPARLFDRYPVIGEYIKKDLGRGLSCMIPLALYGDRDHTYPTPHAHAFENLTAAIKNDMDMVSGTLSGNDRIVRLAAVVIAWNVIQHFYPYFDVVRLNWNDVLTETLRSAQMPQNEMEFLLTLRKMVVKLEDSQANVYHPVIKNQAGVPFKVDWVENQLVITVSMDKRFRRGDIILSIDGRNAEQELLKTEDYISGSPQWKLNRALSLFGFGDENSTAHFIIRRNKTTIELEAVRNFRGQIREFIRKPVQELKNNLYYVDLEQVTMKELAEVKNKLAEASGVIFDVRGYVAFEKRNILAHLVDSPIQTPIWHFPEVIYPDREKIGYTDHYEIILPKKPRIKGKVIFLTNGNTIGTSETFIGIVEHYRLGKIVGQQTAGTNGNINPFHLPGGYMVLWTGLRVLKQNHSRHHLIGITPTIQVKRTIAGIRQGKDEILEKIELDTLQQ